MPWYHVSKTSCCVNRVPQCLKYQNIPRSRSSCLVRDCGFWARQLCCELLGRWAHRLSLVDFHVLVPPLTSQDTLKCRTWACCPCMKTRWGLSTTVTPDLLRAEKQAKNARVRRPEVYGLWHCVHVCRQILPRRLFCARSTRPGLGVASN